MISMMLRLTSMTGQTIDRQSFHSQDKELLPAGWAGRQRLTTKPTILGNTIDDKLLIIHNRSDEYSMLVGFGDSGPKLEIKPRMFNVITPHESMGDIFVAASEGEITYDIYVGTH